MASLQTLGNVLQSFFTWKSRDNDNLMPIRLISSHIDTNSKVTGHVGPLELEEAIKDADIGNNPLDDTCAGA